MLKRAKIDSLSDYFTGLSQRRESGFYFCRINGYSQEIHDFILEYYLTAKSSGVVIEGKIPNPNQQNLSYYTEMMGTAFRVDAVFISENLKKWLPRMNHQQNVAVSSAIYNTLLELRNKGKNDNILKNTYIKFMCWLYYKFERVVSRLGSQCLPKILCEGPVGNYDLLFLHVLSTAGCDIVLLQYDGDANYLSIDPDSSFSEEWKKIGMTAFPDNFHIKQLRGEIQQKQEVDRLYGPLPICSGIVNSWCDGKLMESVLRGSSCRGSEPNRYYNCFGRISGAEDKLTYQNELFQFQQTLRNERRNIVIVSNMITPPAPEEIAAIRRQNYSDITQMIQGLSINIRFAGNQEIQKIAHKAFIDLMIQESQQQNVNINRLTNRAVYILCWLNRYINALFRNWKNPEVACFLFFGACKSANEVLFLRFLSYLPVDVLAFNPNLNQSCSIVDPRLVEEHYDFSVNITEYPAENAKIATVAFHAERDLDTLMYQGSGIYRTQQYTQANAIPMQTMCEEIPILWNQELKYRPSFSVVDNVVNIPVFFSKISGIKNGDVQQYWSNIKALLTPDTLLIRTVPNITMYTNNPIKPYCTEFIRSGRLQKNKILQHKSYQYGFLREAVQQHVLDKLQILLDKKLIRGTFVNGTEYTIIATALNLDKSILRLLQKFDFTVKNPKLIYIITDEKSLSLEDSIQCAFLNLLGFDILFYVPTGYQCVEQHFSVPVIEEHQNGEYVYDLQVPNFETISSNPRASWRDIIFKRGT